MKKTILLLCVLTVSLYAGAQTEPKFFEGEDMTIVSRVSPNGKYAVGSNLESDSWGMSVNPGSENFIWDIESNTIEWAQNSDATGKSIVKHYADINDEKVICGNIEDPDRSITVTDMGVSYPVPLHVAAVWKDGNLISLDFGDYDTGNFKYSGDGSYAVAISNNSKVVGGFVTSGNDADAIPCAWVRNDDTGEYEYVEYAMPDGVTYGEIKDLSDDGSIAVGFIVVRDFKSGAKHKSCYWTSPDTYIIVEDPSVITPSGCAYAVSGNGEYIALTFDGRQPSLYSVSDGSFVNCGRYEDIKGIEISAVTNSGDIFGTFKYGISSLGNTSSMPFWYSHSNRTITDFNYFLKIWAPGLDVPYGFTYEAKENVSIASASADGKVITGNGTNIPFVITTDAEDIVLPPTVKSLTAKMSAVGEVTINIQLDDAPNQYKAKEILIYRDSQLAATVPAENGNTFTYVDKGVTAGEHYYTASVVYTDTENGNREIESPRSTMSTIQMEDKFDFPFHEDFDAGDLLPDDWTIVKDYGETDYQNIGCPRYKGLRNTRALNSTVMQYLPYSYSAVSRFFSAAETESVYISFAREWGYVNSRDWPLEQDTISLEISTDGSNWETVKDFRLCDFLPDRWSYEYLDLTPWAAGNIFKIRFRLHGTGAAQYTFNVDDLKIAEKPEREGMTDVLGCADADGKFRLAWKNTLDAYPLTYLTDPYFNSYGRAIGDEGNTIIAANMFTKEDLAIFNGKYLTSVTTTINHDVNIEGTTDTHASIMIFEDNELIMEQEFTPVYNTDQIVKLDNPLQIDATKELKIGVKVFDYDARQLPLPYYNSYEYVAGKSDIYSQDGGKTWLKLSDLWAGQENELDGYASWQITGNVTDDADVEVPTTLDINRFAAEVYKNGEKLTDKFVYLLEPGYTDETSVMGDTYQVRIFYADGTCTELSNTVSNNGATSVTNAETAADGSYAIDGDVLKVNGENSTVTLYDASGLKLYEGKAGDIQLNGYGKGVYVMKIKGEDGTVKTYKFVF